MVLIMETPSNICTSAVVSLWYAFDAFLLFYVAYDIMFVTVPR